MRQPLQYVAQPRIELLAVDLGGLEQTVDLCTGSGAVDVIAEQPCFAPMKKGFMARSVVSLSISKSSIWLQLLACYPIRSSLKLSVK